MFIIHNHPRSVAIPQELSSVDTGVERKLQKASWSVGPVFPAPSSCGSSSGRLGVLQQMEAVGWMP